MAEAVEGDGYARQSGIGIAPISPLRHATADNSGNFECDDCVVRQLVEIRGAIEATRAVS